MTLLKNQRTEKHLNDVNFHLDNLKLGINTLQLDYNREKQIYLFCEKALETLSLIERLINVNTLQQPIKIATTVNDLFLKDNYLSVVNVQIVNTKRSFNPSGIAYLKIAL